MDNSRDNSNSINETDIYNNANLDNSYYSKFYLSCEKNNSTTKIANSKSTLEQNKNEKIFENKKENNELDRIDNNFSLQKEVNQNKEKVYSSELNLSPIKISKDSFLEDSLKKDEFLNKNFKFPNEEDILLRIDGLYNGYLKLKERNFLKKNYIRCFIKDKNNIIKCNRIPLIKKMDVGLLFYCKDNQRKEYLDIEELLKLIIRGELFSNLSENEAKKTNTNQINNNNIFIE